MNPKQPFKQQHPPAGADRSTPALLSYRQPTEPGLRTCLPETIPAGLLFQGHQEILIGHNGDTYRLRITRNGKLILTK